MPLTDALAPLLKVLAARLDPAHLERIATGWEAERVLGLRVNPLRGSADETWAELRDLGVHTHPLSPLSGWAPKAVEPAVRHSPAYREGRIYLQSLSSQVPALLAPQHLSGLILDACAAPGGKTTQLAARFGANRVFACERAAVRAQKLAHNLRLQGAAAVRHRVGDARSLPERWRDYGLILVDAPCSGTGVVRTQDERSYRHLCSDPAAYLELKAHQQSQLLQALALRCAAHGWLIYSTCSVDPLENESVVAAFLQHHPTWHSVDLSAWRERWTQLTPGLPLHAEANHWLRLDPDRQAEGFFVAALQQRNAD